MHAYTHHMSGDSETAAPGEGSDGLDASAGES